MREADEVLEKLDNVLKKLDDMQAQIEKLHLQRRLQEVIREGEYLKQQLGGIGGRKSRADRAASTRRGLTPSIRTMGR
jgi:hypothetical protein